MQFSAGVNLSYTMEFANKGDFKSIEKFVDIFKKHANILSILIIP
jgi:3-hydroxyacyl-CoA dehydrogenase